MGGDRDGNPNVTPLVTLEVAVTQRMQVARLLLNDVVLLYKELAVCKGFSPEMVALAANVKKSYDKRELYRRVLGHVKLRLMATIDWCEDELKKIASDDKPVMLYVPSTTSELSKQTNSFPSIDCNVEPEDYGIMGSPDAPLYNAKDLTEILVTMHRSLTAGGYADVADGLLTDLIRRVASFGLTLAPLDIRQESTRHTMAIDAITRYLGIGSYAQWDESTKINWLQSELSSKRPLFSFDEMPNLGFDDLVMDTIKTLQVASSLGPGSLGAYVISQAKAASDVLGVMLLQKQCGMTATNGKLMRVAPLFETLTDLTNAPEIVETLFSLPNYLGIVRNTQEIMVGYSDSAKDAGRLAACWAQYESQEKMVRVAAKYGVELTFFHGKGGTVGRGGNPALYRAVLAHPPGTINGRFRVTEQGEMITQNFGSTGIAERTLDIYTAAVLAEQFSTHVQPKPAWRKLMDKLSVVSCDSYRTLIAEQRFISYFRKATPELELGSLNIGSRPTKRNPQGGIESLRAIPWTFAWTQTRLHLPAWVGVGEAFDKGAAAPGTIDAEDKEMLREMYNSWPFFREMVDLIAMTLSKTDLSISANYELQLVDKQEPELLELGAEIRRKLIQTRRSILQVTGCDDFSSGYKLLQMSMKVRYPYVDPLNVIQTEAMRRLRHVSSLTAEEKQLLEDSLIVSINGIAQGMKNSG
jgi:phosphoenolpyruvate carboxylase